MSALSGLTRLIARARAPAHDACDVCGGKLAQNHRHLVDLESKRLGCACHACALAFSGGSGRYRTIPLGVRRDGAFAFSEGDFRALGVPVGLFFLFRESSSGRWAVFYPGSAGAVLGDVSQSACLELAARHAIVAGLEADVEALLVRRRRDGTLDAFAVPVDECYRLTALVRATHRGFDGAESRHAVDEFLAGLERRSTEAAARSPTRLAGGERAL